MSKFSFNYQSYRKIVFKYEFKSKAEATDIYQPVSYKQETSRISSIS